MATTLQQKQLDFLEKIERREELYRQPQLSCSCNDCGPQVDGVFSSADGARTFIKIHWGHRTWVQHLGTIKHRGMGDY